MLSQKSHFTYKLILPALLFAGGTLSVMAQQSLDESIAVDGRYAAEVIRMERLASFPAEYPMEVQRLQLSYDLEPLSARFYPYSFPLPMPAFDNVSYRGYLDAAMGSWLDSRLKAGGWILPPKSSSPWSLGAWIDHNSTSLWRPKLEDGSKGNKRYDYDEAIGLQGGYRLKNGQTISARLDYGVRYFDYFMAENRPTQTINKVKGQVDWSSSAGSALLHDLGLEVSHFAYRSMTLPGFTELPWKPSRQTNLHLSGFIAGSVSGHVRGGLDAIRKAGGMSLKADLYGVFGNYDGDYGLFSFTPTYLTSWHGWNLDAGVRIDFGAKAGTSAESFSAIHLAPAVNLWYPSAHFTFYAKAMGGSEIQTLERRAMLSKWLSPCEFSHVPVFAPIDAAVGFNAGPAETGIRGLEGGLQFRWKAVSHLPMYGWYPLAMAVGGDEAAELLVYNQGTTSLHGFEISGRLGWSLRDIVKLDLSLAYTPQHNTRGFFNGIDRARWVGNGALTLHPVSPLSIKVSTDWRGVRYVYSYTDINGDMEGYRLSDWFALNLEADWQLTSNLTLGLGFYNLTGRSNEELPAVPTEGFTATGRLSWLF